MNILLVDDEASFRLLLGDHLVEQGFKVFLADNGDEGIRKIVQEKIDIVVSDLYMHVMDGIKFCKSTRALPGFRDLPFLFVSAYEDAGTLGTIRSFKNSAFLRKGGPMSEVTKWIKHLTTPTAQGGGYSRSETLPPLPAETQAAGRTPKTVKDPSQCLVLVADDDEALRTTLRDTLAAEGYGVFTAADGFEAMDLIQKQTFDLALLDIVMPSISGFDVLKFVKEKTPSTRVIMITAYADLKLAVESKKLGAHDFIAKPFMHPDLLNTIRLVLSA